MVPLREASRGHPRAATCGFVARKGTLAESHITYLAPHNARPHHNLRHGKWLHPLEVFFNITNRLVVMAFKLCQEGNKEPLFNKPYANASQLRKSGRRVKCFALLTPRFCCELPNSRCAT